MRRSIMLCFLLFLVGLVCAENQYSQYFKTASPNDINQYVINGDVVNHPTEFPWQLSLQRYGFHYCGAVLLNSQFALTAAHCVETIDFGHDVAKCGAFNIHVNEHHRQSALVVGVRIHPDYDPNGSNPAFPNDIAVLKLQAGYISDSEWCRPGALASPGYDYTLENATITGWGDIIPEGHLPGRLKVGHVQVLHPDDCYYRWGPNVHHNMHICLKDLEDKYYGMCHGDSGGPAHVGNIVVGVASFMSQGCQTQYPSVYTRVSTYLDFIMWAIGDMLSK